MSKFTEEDFDEQLKQFLDLLDKSHKERDDFNENITKESKKLLAPLQAKIMSSVSTDTTELIGYIQHLALLFNLHLALYHGKGEIEEMLNPLEGYFELYKKYKERKSDGIIHEEETKQ
jgi:hypothetical protein